MEERIQAELDNLANEIDLVAKYADINLSNQVFKTVQSAMNERRKFYNVEYRRKKQRAIGSGSSSLLGDLVRELDDEVDDQRVEIKMAFGDPAVPNHFLSMQPPT